MAPPSKRPPQGRKPSQGKRPPQGKGQASARKPAGEAPAASSGAATTGGPVTAETSPSAAETSNIAEERKAKREAARQERIAIARGKAKAKRKKQTIIAGAVILALLGAIFYGVNKSRGERQAALQAAQAAGCGEVQQLENEGREHRPLSEEIALNVYQTNPPTSGPHYAERVAVWGSYNEEVPPSTLVHNLEHGGIVVHHKGLADAQIDVIDGFVDEYSDGVISNPNENIDSPLAIASWDRLQECESFSAEAVAAYIQEHCNNAPEKLSTCRR